MMIRKKYKVIKGEWSDFGGAMPPSAPPWLRPLGPDEFKLQWWLDHMNDILDNMIFICITYHD